MVIYSHSRISCFQKCPHKFRLRYIDKVKPETEQTIESFMGSIVHKALEKLYSDAKFQRIPTLSDFLLYYGAAWAKEWNPSITIVRKEYSAENYRKMGEKYLADYYRRHYPFDQAKTVGLEQRVVIDLDGNGKYKLQGYIDRLSYLGDGRYEIHDYKTSASMPLLQYLEDDRQLALYALAVLKSYPNAKDAKLIWHFLSYDERVVLEKTPEELEELRRSVISDIEKIEAATEYPTKVSALCDWCEFRALCPEWAHVAKTEGLSIGDFLKDSGVDLVNRYAELSAKKCEVEGELDGTRQKLIAFARENNVRMVSGSSHNAKIWMAEKLKFPGREEAGRAELEGFLKKAGLWSDVSSLDTYALSKLMDKPPWPADITAAIERLGRKEMLAKVYLNMKDEKV
jgi:putative RecB family exonuclease